MPLPMLDRSWQDVIMDFVLELSKTTRKHDFVFVVVDLFSKMFHFLAMQQNIRLFQDCSELFDGVVKFAWVAQNYCVK